jgi:hypothetical protein
MVVSSDLLVPPVIGNGLAAGNARAVAHKISPTDIFGEEGSEFSFESLFRCPTSSVCAANRKRVYYRLCATTGGQMIIKQWMHREYRIDLHDMTSKYTTSIYEPGNAQKLSYTPEVEKKHGQRAAEEAAEVFIDERLEKKKRPGA